MTAFATSMDSSQRISDFAAGSTRRVAASWNYAARQPSWVTRAALVAFMLVIAIPVVLLLLFALVVATVLFLVLAGANRIIAVFKGILPRRDGRENVIVRRPRE